MMFKLIFNFKVYPYGLLAVLVGLGMTMGLWQEIITPTLPNLKEKLNVSYESIGKLISVRCSGSIMALLLAGYLYDSFPSYVPYMMFGECILGGLVTIIIPWCTQSWVVAVLLYLQGALQSSLNNGGQLTVLKTFKDKSVGKMQIYHLGYGIGGLLSGLISQPFLPKQVSNEAKITKYCSAKLAADGLKGFTQSSLINNVTSSIYKASSQGSFEYIYLIAGIITIVNSFIFLAFVSFKNPMKLITETKAKESWLEKIKPKYIADGRTGIAISMIALLFSYYAFYNFGHLIFVSYIVVYAMDPCKGYSMNQDTAVYLHSAVNGCFLIGRIFGSLVLDLHPTLIILLFNSCSILFVLVLIIFSNQYALALWIGACGMRFCNSIVYPSGTSYINRYIVVTSTLISIAFIGTSVGEISGPITGGYLIDNYPSYYILYACFIVLSVFLLVVVIIVIIGLKIGLRDFTKETVSRKVSKIELHN